MLLKGLNNMENNNIPRLRLVKQIGYEKQFSVFEGGQHGPARYGTDTEDHRENDQYHTKANDKQLDVLSAIKDIADMGLNTTGGLSNVSNGMPKHIRPIVDSNMLAMAMMCGFTSAIVNPCDTRLMETVKSCDIIKNNFLYADSFLEM